MSLYDLVKENENLINDFTNKNLDQSNPQVLSALNTLDNTNELEEFFVITKDDITSIGGRIFRLYGLLQGLFVAIDALYDLAYGLTNSKRFININQNPELRELKYIRNDVVGHPTNRVYDDNVYGYCILKKEDIKAMEFSYTIISEGNEHKKTVFIEKMLLNFYEEANQLLRTLYRVSSKLEEVDSIQLLARKIYREFNDNISIKESLIELKNEYLNNYTCKTDNQDRFLWRYDLITKLENISFDDQDLNGLKEYALGFEIAKICSLVSSDMNIELEIKREIPKILGSVFRFMNNNQGFIYIKKYLYDATHPLFVSSLNKAIEKASKIGSENALKYFKLIKLFYDKKNYDLVYCFGILLKLYRESY